MAAGTIDQELILAVGRELVDKDPIPPVLNHWLTTAAPDVGSVERYTAWHSVLTEAFGPRTFVPFPLTAAEVYHG
jgi:hypothetical protein